MNNNNLVKIIVFCIISIGSTFWISAKGFAETDKTLSPYFLIENGDPSIDQFPLKATDVQVTVNGVIAEVVVSQQYENLGTRPINARYVFPASTRAAVHGMKMIIGEDVIVAKVKEKQAAKKAYSKAKQEGKSASLLNQERPNVFTMNVANMMPNDIVTIELRYTELLIPENGCYEFVYPTVVGPRYTGEIESEASAADKWVKSPYMAEPMVKAPEFNLHAEITSAIPIQDAVCNSHKTHIDWIEDRRIQVRMDESEINGGNRDFILRYRLSGELIETGLMMYEGQKENFFLLMVQPPERYKETDIPAREYIFVVDVSGSMNGFPLETAKILLKDLIGHLRSTDTFNVILFAGCSNIMSEQSLPAGQENIEKAIALIDRQRGGGGTELKSAVNRALNLPHSENVSRSIIIITDGYISAEADVFATIAENLENTNVFSFGIGSSVNRHLIEGLAKAGQGEPFVIVNPYEAKDKARLFREYVLSPILTNIKINYEGLETYDTEPLAVCDLFADRPLIIFGKWRGLPRGRIRISGQGGDGYFLQTFQVSESQPSNNNRVLPYLWARKRISGISDFNFGGMDDERKREITDLGLTYNLLTQFTSFIAVHETVRNPENDSRDVKQPLQLPKNVSRLAVGGTSMARVPEPEISIMIIFFIIIAWFIGCKKIMDIDQTRRNR